MSAVLSKAAAISRKASVLSAHLGSSQGTITPEDVETGLSAPPLVPQPPAFLLPQARRRSFSSPTRPSSRKGQAPAHLHDRLIMSLLRQYKRLEVDLAKFSLKNNSVTKTNILRKTVLPFLRSINNLEHNFAPSLKVYRSLVSISSVFLIKWLNALLQSLNSRVPNMAVTSSDRNAYLECISRIISRHEWENVDPDTYSQYQKCLASTMDYCVNKLHTMKILPMSMAAFVGKVFAYGFFHLPKVSSALLFLLNVKQSVFDSSAGSMMPPVLPETAAELRALFPETVHSLINYRGMGTLEKHQKSFLNAVSPPQHPVTGIKDPNGPWVRRWCSSDSDVFNSFFRHYVSILNQNLAPMSSSKGVSAAVLFSCPGFSVILSHIFQIFNVSISRILKATATKPNSGSPDAFMFRPEGAKQSLLGPLPIPSNVPLKQHDMYYNSIIKIFKTVRDVNYSDVAFSSDLTRLIDGLFILIAKDISVYDHTKNGLILNIMYEFSNHTLDCSTIDWEFWLSCSYLMLHNSDHIQILLKNFAFLFNVWDKIPESLTSKKHIHEKYLLLWMTDVHESYRLNFVNWMISDEVMLKFLCHWHPIVRSYYLRLLVWRILGINNYESSSSIQITRRIESKLTIALDELTRYSYNTNLSFRPDSPLANRRFSVIPISSKNEFIMINDDPEISRTSTAANISKPSELRKTHPFEIFDEAIYTCSSLPLSSGNDDSAASSSDESRGEKPIRNSSLVNSLGRLFKILTPDDQESPKKGVHNLKKSASEKNESLRKSKNSVSMTSLSTTYSMKSRLSSPSIMSFKSTPTALTDLSTASSFTSDSDASSTDTSFSDLIRNTNKANPPEIFKVPPEIVRPNYKFEIIVDHESMGEKFMVMQNSNSTTNNRSRFFYHPVYTNNQLMALPSETRIPSVSIFVNVDPYNKFFISSENILTADHAFVSDNEKEEMKTFVAAFHSTLSAKNQVINWVNLGKSLNEWNMVVDEFERYLFSRVEADQLSYALSYAEADDGSTIRNGSSGIEFDANVNELNYFKRIVPFLPVDGSNEFKLLNAG